MEGQELLFKKIRKGGTVRIVVGIILTLIGGFLSLCGIALVASHEETTGGIVMTIIFLPLLIWGIYLIVRGVKLRKDPTKHSAFKKNPDLLFQVKELYSDIKYQDKRVVISSRVIGSATDITQAAFLNEVFWIYVYTQSYNYVMTSKMIILATARDQIVINAMGMKEEELRQLLGIIVSVAPYARLGYSNENMTYCEYMRNVWEASKANQQMGVNQQVGNNAREGQQVSYQNNNMQDSQQYINPDGYLNQ